MRADHQPNVLRLKPQKHADQVLSDVAEMTGKRAQRRLKCVPRKPFDHDDQRADYDCNSQVWQPDHHRRA